MSLLVAGCSLSSGWGFEDHAKTWPHIVAKKLDLPLTNLAQTAASNQDIFLSAVNKRHEYSLRLIQWTALNRITVSPSPVNDHVILSVHDRFLEDAALGLSQQEIRSFTKVLAVLNQDWKPYFDLVEMIEILQQEPETYFINGLLPWDLEFFSRQWTMPFTTTNAFLESLLQINEFDDQQLERLLDQVLRAQSRIDQSRWINLAPSWNSTKVDAVSAVDGHPGPLSQINYAGQVLNYILV